MHAYAPKESRSQRAPAPALQAKLAINRPGDVYEQEADHISEQVMRMPAPCTCGGSCSKCRGGHSDAEHSIQTKRVPAGGAGAAAAPSNVQQVLDSGGQALDAGARRFMEPRFHFDFSRVRVHSGTEAEESARGVNALAYTVGHHIVFGANQYAPSSQAGRRLLAHELAHVVQQNGASAMLQREPGPDKDKKDTKPKKAYPDCKYTVNYVNKREIDCDKVFRTLKGKAPPGKMCGRTVQYDLESVSTSGKCPPLKGLRLTETKQLVAGKASCLPPGFKFQDSGDCEIEADGKLKKDCNDVYGLCAPLADINSISNGGCENTITQKIFIDGQEAETHTIHVEIDGPPTSCETTMTRDGKRI